MNKKFRTLLSEKCKDMGLTAKALDELTTMGSEGLAEDASDEDISKKVDLLVPFAKAMQAEITRKTRGNNNSQSQQQSSNNGEGNEGGNGSDKDIPEWFKSEMKKRDEQLAALQTENETLKTEGIKTARANAIAAKAKALGIPDFLMKRFSVADDADIDKELTDYKQDLVTNKLMSADAAHEQSTSEAALKEEAKRFAEGLPNK